jgi:glycosyltransferase involved in cell wall biosynthesis
MGHRPLRVAALVDLERWPGAGGHVKCWERLAQAAARHPGAVDLTVHFQGTAEAREELAPHVRIEMHRPLFSTRRLKFLKGIADHTDLAPLHPRVMRSLRDVDVIHTTDAYFAYARTAMHVSRRRGIPLTSSIHTNTPGYVPVYTEQAIRTVFGNGATFRLMAHTLRLPERAAAVLRSGLMRHARACARVLIGERDDLDAARALFGERVGRLRRGIDRGLFSPGRRDRQRLADRYGIALDRFVLFYAGRVDVGKSVMDAARATRMLLDRGLPVHLLMAGEGKDIPAIRDLLGPHATLPGTVPPSDIAWLYASSDLFVFPSRVEVSPNVVIEAKASGLPVIVAAQGGGIFVTMPGADGIVIEEPTVEAWAEAIESLYADPARRKALAAAGYQDVVRHRPSWDQVFQEDLVPVWEAAWTDRRRQAAVGRPLPPRDPVGAART